MPDIRKKITELWANEDFRWDQIHEAEMNQVYYEAEDEDE